MLRLRTRGIVVGTVAAAFATTLSMPAVGAGGTERDLASLFPATLEGQPLAVETYSGPAWVARFDPDDPDDAVLIARTDDMLRWLGKTLDDLTIATALHEPRPGDVSTVTAIRVRGTSAFDHYAPLTMFWLPFEVSDSESRVETIAGRPVFRARDEQRPGAYPLSIYRPLGDTSWLIDAQRPVLTEIVGALPPPGGRLEVPELGIAVTFPDDWYVEYEGPSQLAAEPEMMGTIHSLPAGLLGPDDTAWYVAYGRPDLPGECAVQLYETSELTLDAFVDFYSSYDPSMGGTPYEVTEVVRRDDMPTGEAVGLVGNVTLPFADENTPKPAVVQYAIDGGDVMAVVRCGGEPPADRWLSVVESLAETIEFLPREGDEVDE